MIVSPLVLALVIGAPSFSVDPDVGATAAIERESARHWAALERLWVRTTGRAVKGPPNVRVHARRDFSAGFNGRSTPGVVQLRPTRGAPTERQRIALRHELAHQLLLAACPAAARDRLFHEAFAIWTSGEQENWLSEHITVREARRRLRRGIDDRPSTRAAIARVLAEADAERALTERMRDCEEGPPLTIEALAQAAQFSDAMVVISRHSGEVLAHDGASALKMPFGSTLKPFVVSAHGPGPELDVPADVPMWACHARGPKMGAEEALLRSCNGYFLDWPALPADFGRYQPLFDRFEVRPRVVAEAVGLASRLGLSAFELAQAYRVLAEADPAILATLDDNAKHGTLADTGFSAEGATKTGTVRDADSRPRVGWIVFVDDDVVAVMARRGRAPRTFAAELDAVVRGLDRASLVAVERAGDFAPGCGANGIAVSVSRDRVVVDAHVPDARWLCLGAPTVNGAGVVDGRRLRTRRGQAPRATLE